MIDFFPLRIKYISLKITAAVLALLLAVSLLYIWRGASYLRTTLLRRLDVEGASLAHSAAAFCVEPLVAQDYPVLETYAEEIVRITREVWGVSGPNRLSA